ncbi:MAG TPA: adenylate/guanylate cyclase domain-containing protein [Gaiellaceae bacterium]|nr:adenylate/guanylate cyclase domain-containing protein [Gaiellaceae bacterium]
MTDISQRLEQAHNALAGKEWQTAYEALVELDGAENLDADDLNGLADAAWWTGRMDESIEARTRAYAARLERGEQPAAALSALHLARDHELKRSGLQGAWLARAERLLAEEDDSPERGYLERMRSRLSLAAGDYDSAIAHAEQTLELGSRFQEPNLMALGLHDKGSALVRQGDWEAGLALIDEATVGAVSGELNPYATGIIYCGVIAASFDVADLARAGNWTEAATRWCERQSISGFPGVCRVNRAEVMRLRGSWPEAEEEIRTAVAELGEFAPSVAASAFYELGELQLRMGDLAAAEKAFRQAHGLGVEPQPGLALLRLTNGEVESAHRGLRRALADEARNRLSRARLLPASVEISLAAGEVDEAKAASEELAEIAQDYGTTALAAHAAAAAGAVALAEEDADAALGHLRRAVRLYQEVEIPYEGARARLLAAEAYRLDGDADAADLELRAAAATFDRLGAVRDVRRTAEALGRLAAAAGGERAGRTFLYTDICDSTPLVEAIGDKAWVGLVGWHDRTLRELFGQYGGEEVGHAGDGFFVAFPDPTSALECAAAVQRRLAAHRRTNGFAPEVRIGVHAAEASRSAAGYSGKGVHEAARVGALGGPGEIYASLVTARLVNGFAYSDPKTVTLKGITEPLEVVTIDWR